LALRTSHFDRSAITVEIHFRIFEKINPGFSSGALFYFPLIALISADKNPFHPRLARRAKRKTRRKDFLTTKLKEKRRVYINTLMKNQ